MSKTKSGFMLVVGLALALIGGSIMQESRAGAFDVIYGLVILVGIIIFFFGALNFSRGEK